MDHDQRLKIARRIVADGIARQLKDERQTPGWRDMEPRDQETIAGMVQQISNGTAYVEFTMSGNIWTT